VGEVRWASPSSDTLQVSDLHECLMFWLFVDVNLHRVVV
jgi:hypothetical protein